MTKTLPVPGQAGQRSRPNGSQPVPETEAEALASAHGAEPVGIPSPRGIVRTLGSVFARPGPLSREAARLARDTARILLGTQEIAPSPKDRRFTDPAWTTNPAYRRLAQEYVALSDALTRLVDDFEGDDADWREVEQARFILTALSSALAPTNTLVGNPAALKRAFDTGGVSLARGARHWLHDLRHNGGIPAQTDRSAFVVAGISR
jgi:polyhydroxyalkanoate synthase subunit PhaC